MATLFTDVYDVFLRKISDYSFLTISQYDSQKIFNGYLMSSIPRFGKQCYKDLTNRTDTQFNIDLADDEKEILGTLMLVEWLNPVLNDTKLLRLILTDKDFRVYSPAQQIDRVMAVHKKWKDEASYLITKYTWENGDIGGFSS